MKPFLFFILILCTFFSIQNIDLIAVRILFSFVIFCWFLFLDQFAREKIYSSNWINWPLGHLASMICLLPFFQWKTMHANKENLLPIQRRFIPPFNAVAFSMKNFWNIKRLWSLYKEKAIRKQFIISILAMNLMLMGIIPRIPSFWIKYGPSYLGFLLLAEFYLHKFQKQD